MKLGDLTYEEAKDKFYRREMWGWTDGLSDRRGAAFINSEGKIRYSSRSYAEYTYDCGHRDDWYEVDSRGYRVPLTVIHIGGE